MDARVTTSDGAELFVRTAGSGAPVIIPLACWCEEYETLADCCQVVLYDPCGRGRSSPAWASSVSFEADIEDLERVRAHLDLEMIALIGWSYYGGVAARYAMRYAERIARLVLVSSTPVPAGSCAPQTRERMRAFWNAFLESRSAVKPRHGQKSPPSEFENERPEHVFPLIDILMCSMGDWDWRGEARAIDAPALVVDGAADIQSYEACREWLAALPNARAALIEGAGHFPSFEIPDRYFAMLREFLIGDWPASCTTSI